MKPFTVHTGVAAPLLRDNVDTDAIIPSREMRRVSKHGLADGLFAGWRYLAGQERERVPDPEFVLNQPAYAGATILLGGHNFGCGSSREHAVWALVEYGIRSIIAVSFASIFRNNCGRNGILPVVLPRPAIEAIADRVAADPQNQQVTINLESLSVDQTYSFEVDAAQREMLLKGLDPIELTLTHLSDIEAFRKQDRAQRSWAYLEPG
ncbi:MAG: 3-isopropylmalate dehydratase small subunit [Pseudomonadota bacterium]